MNQQQTSARTKAINSTLTRWHKVAERLQQGAGDLARENREALQAGQHIQHDAFSVRKESMTAAAAKALGERTELYFKLHDALFDIRAALAHANTKHEVSDLLNKKEKALQRMTYFDGLLATAKDCLSVAEFAALASKRANTTTGMFDVSVTFISAEKLAELTKARDSARRDRDNLADRLASANATQLQLALDEQVVEFLGL